MDRDCNLYRDILRRRLQNDSSTLIALNRMVIAHVVECLDRAMAEITAQRLALERYACDCKEICSENHQKEYYCGAEARRFTDKGDKNV
jgi:hypothetical protein